MPLISITFHSYFLSIIYARASYLANDLATETSTLHISAYTSLRTFTVVPSMFNHHVSSSHHPLYYQRVNVRTQAQAVIRKKLRYTVILLEI